MQVHGVSVRVERVPCIPHGAKVLIDEPAGEERVAWVRDDLDDQEAAALVATALVNVATARRLRHDLALHAS